MKKSILKIAFILLITLSAITFYSYSSLELEIYGFEIKKINISDFISIQDKDSDTVQPVSHFYRVKGKNVIKQKDTLDVVDSTSQRILLIGDSMTEGIMRAMTDYCDANNHKLMSIVWVSSSISGWCKSKRLQSYASKFKPTYVMIVLGSNELFVPNSPVREKYIRELITQAEPAKVVWIGPPNWKPDKGIYDQLIEVLGEKRVFVSKKLAFERQKDGIHPTFKSSRYWTEAISEWIMDESKYKIKLKKPDNNKEVKPEVIYYNN